MNIRVSCDRHLPRVHAVRAAASRANPIGRRGPLLPRALDSAGLLSLQRSIGNSAVGALLGDSRPPDKSVIHRDAQPDPPTLTSPAIAGNARLQKAYHNSPSLARGETGEAVKVLQRALVAVGFGNLLTKSMKGGQPDGVYGGETFDAVRAFQTGHGVRPVGGSEVGHKTLLALDRALGAGPAPSPSGDAQKAELLTKTQTVEDPGSKTDNGEVVQKPKPKVNPTDTSVKTVDDDSRLSGNVVINVGGAMQWNTAKADPPPTAKTDFDPLCEHGVMQIGGKLNVPWSFNPAARKVKYFPEFELDIDFAPTFCKRLPSLSLQITAIKLKLSDTFELVFNATAGTQGPRGWFANGAAELDIHPFRSGFFKPLEIDAQLNGGGLLIPVASPGHDFNTGTFGGQVVIKYTF